MILPSDAAGRTTHTVGYFETHSVQLANWIKEIERRSTTVKPREKLCNLLADVLSSRIPETGDRRDLLIPLGQWTALLNNASAGTDLGPLPWKAPDVLSSRAIKAVSSYGFEHPSVMFEVYDPACPGPLHSRRLIRAACDRGRWSFGTEGEPFDFEEVENYSKRRIRDRFTPEMLERYLRALGVPMLESADAPIEGAILVASEG
ncbi:hypothetical protein [Haloechinothrix halophila]|uniref:hypothetical protein n=1 Tax=Haloechinothrix halophila TaxID=1069073 RepID=UPI0012FA4B8D|nr:hypothetical protein [Haloechinothrix halophila]